MGFISGYSTRQRITVAVWLIGMLAAATLIARRPTSQIRGLAWAESVALAAPSDGKLANFEVSLHQNVATGEVIARLDEGLLEARRQVHLAEIESLALMQTADQQGQNRLFERDREEAGRELAELKARVKEGEARLASLTHQLAIDERLVQEGLAPRNQAVASRNARNVVETRLNADRQRMRLATTRVHLASDRAATAPQANQWQIEAAHRELRHIEEQIESLVLRSPISGQITEIYRNPGEWLRSSEPVLRVSPIATDEVHAWLDGRTLPDLQPGLEAVIRRGSGQVLTGRVESFGAERLQIPPAIWARSDVPEWGYPVRIRIDGSERLAPGEPVQVGLKVRGF